MTIQLTFELVDLVIFLIIAFIAGTAASALLFRYSYRNSAVVSTILGVVGAFVGQYVFDALDVELSGRFFQRAISIADIFIAFMGAVIILLLAALVRRL